MAETSQEQRPPEKQEANLESPRGTTGDEELGDEDELDIDISDLVAQSQNLAKNYKQKGGQ